MYEFCALAHGYLPEIFIFRILPLTRRIGKQKDNDNGKSKRFLYTSLYKLSEIVCFLDEKTKLGEGGSYSILVKKTGHQNLQHISWYHC